jgi:hypothetical protein
VLNASSTFVDGFEIGNNLDRAENSAQAVLHIAEVQGRAQIWWRFGGGSDRNRALLGNEDNSMHGMQIAQRLINTGDFVSC